MDEEQVNTIRESSRNILLLNRRKHRDEEADVHRSLDNLGITPSTVVTIANKLKTKSMISTSELQMLKNALMSDMKNIEVVLNTHGALRGLVRELSGHDVSKQCAAAGCCCNLALGDCKAGTAVAKAAGAYLVAALDNLTEELSVTCAWTIGNLAGSGLKACELLSAQGAITKLVELLTNSSTEIREAAVYALEHISHQLKDDLRTEHLHQMLQYLPHAHITSAVQLLFILSCHKDFTHQSVSQDYLLALLENLSVSINKHVSSQKAPELLYLLRIFANINSKLVYDVVLNYFVANNMMDSVKMLLNVDLIKESLLWLLGNMFSCCSDHLFFRSLVM